MARNHRHLLAVLASCCNLWLTAAPATAQEQLAVIVSSKTPGTSIDLVTLRSIYLKKIFISKQGLSLIPVNLPAGDPLRQAFSQVAIHMSNTQLRNYWNRRYFQGVSPPYVLGSQNAVVRFVADTPGAIGYVRPCFLTAEVKPLLLLTLPERLSLDEAPACPGNP